MPRYDYRCLSCNGEFELVQTFAEAGKGVCPVCSGAGRRVFHAVPVIYKGSGFYTTDYGRPKPPQENGASKETSAKKSESSESSSSSENGKAAAKEGPSNGSASSEKSSAKTGSDTKAST